MKGYEFMRIAQAIALLLASGSSPRASLPLDAGPRPEAGVDASLPGAGSGTGLPFSCNDADSELDRLPTAGQLDLPLGDVLRCVRGPSLKARDVDALARSSGYVGRELSHSATALRISYRTERGTEPPRPGFGTAVVLWPDTPKAVELPVLVMAHGTVGLAPGCPPSREDPRDVETYLAELGYPLLGEGYAVVLPDFAGYAAFGAAGNPPPGYHSAMDEAKSMLDAARALRTLSPKSFSSKVVLMGHSQGGHAALSALELHATYGSGGVLAAVVAYAPSWFPMTSFAGMIALASSFPLPDEANSVATSVWYHYSHAELLDGPGEGAQLFAASKRDGIRAFVEHDCDPLALASLGKDIGELFASDFTNEVAYYAATGLPCLSDRCTLWKDRYAADRPHITGAAKDVPVLVLHGDADDWIPPERAMCGFDRLAADGANASVCVVPGALHDPLVGMKSEYVSDWVRWHTLEGDDPGPCGPGPEALHDDSGQPAACAALPPND